MIAERTFATFRERYLSEAAEVIARLDTSAIERAVSILAETKFSGGRLFTLGVGGSAGNASRAVNDFRKFVGIEAYAPTDNVSELTARANDEGWATNSSEWLKVSRLSSADSVLVFSLGGETSSETSVRTSSRPSLSRRESEVRLAGSSGETAATRPRSPTRRSSCRRYTRST